MVRSTIEAAEIAVTRSGVVPVPVRPARAARGHAGPIARSRSPTPSPAASRRHRLARDAPVAPRAARSFRLFARIQDGSRVAAFANRRVNAVEHATGDAAAGGGGACWRSLVVVVGASASGSTSSAASQPAGQAIARATPRQQALARPPQRGRPRPGHRSGRRPRRQRPAQGRGLLTDAYRSSRPPGRAGISATTTAPLAPRSWPASTVCI